jgi:transcriptional regulator with XRE-family HTH domain
MKRKTSEPPHPMDIHVGQRLRAARLLAGFSQGMLGKHVGLTFQQVQKYEKGVNRIGASRLQQFAQLLNVPPGYFFEPTAADGETPPVSPDGRGASQRDTRAPQSGSPSQGHSQSQAVELLQHFGRIQNDALRASILHLVKTAAGSTAEQD